MDVNGHAAIVSGGGSGMGAETARHLARAGARVAVLDVNLDAAQAVAREVAGIAIACDVSDAAAAEAAVAQARDAHGPARVAVNCAGVATAGRIVGREGP
ncbi:MAG TPA: SDR family NAD(P)-dependent oxidoreductase, partial [Arenibaculum sp.]|nr:SDR family NAD(P)-dependent oxidoreductase [Arenibaculum sp.]